MGDLVIDEWIWSDLAGENHSDRRRESFLFLRAIFKKCDRIVIVKGSRFDQKALSLFRLSDVIGIEIIKFYKANFWFNDQKVKFFDPAELDQLQSDLANEIEASDHYLVQALMKSEANQFVTTDNRLKSALERHQITCYHRDEFVPNYVSMHLK